MTDPREQQQLDDVARVFRAKNEIDSAVADLASRPLDEQTAARMREVLDSPRLVEARAALRRLPVPRPAAPVLRLVADPEVQS